MTENVVVDFPGRGGGGYAGPSFGILPSDRGGSCHSQSIAE